MSYSLHILLIQGFLLFYITDVWAENAITIIGKPVREVALGGSLILKCEATEDWSGSNPVLKWYDPEGKEVPSTTADEERENAPDRVKEAETLDSGLKLGLFEFQTKDAGVWICKEEGGTNLQAEVKVEIETKIVIDAKSPISFNKGSTGIIECIARREPPVGNTTNGEITISWKKNNQPITTADGFGDRVRQVSQGLEVQRVDTTDEGSYRCLASDDRTAQAKNIKVSVRVPPTITDPPTRATAAKGSSARFECSASGTPKPSFTWYKVPKDASGGVAEIRLQGDRYTITTEAGADKDKSTLVIKSVIEDDEAQYKCEAKNSNPLNPNDDIQKDSKSAELEVQIAPEIVQLDDMKQKEGQTAQMVCRVHGKPAPTIIWKNEGTGVTLTSENQDGSVSADANVQGKTSIAETVNPDAHEKTSTLTITELKREDGGRYVCEADSDAGQAKKAATLTVEFTPVFATTQKNQVYSWASQKGVLDCLASGVPDVDFRWYFDGQLLTNGAKYTMTSMKDTDAGADMYKGTLVTAELGFHNPELYGEYTCEAFNDIGSRNHSITLRKADMPVRPAIDEKEVTPTTVDLQVTVGKVVNGPQPTKIYWKYAMAGGTETNPVHKAANVGKNTLEIADLLPSQTYTLTIYAESEAGAGAEATHIVNTPQERVPYAPKITSNPTGVRANIYDLEWKAPKTGGSPITGYTYKIKETKIKDELTVDNEWQQDDDYQTGFLPSVTITGNVEATRISNLRPDTYFYLEIRAINKDGQGDMGHFIFKTNKESANLEDTTIEKGEQIGTEDLDLPIGIIILIVVIVFIVLFVIVDVTCYFRNKCGVIMCLKDRFAAGGTADTRSKEPIMEAGDGSKDTLPIRGIQNSEKDGVVMEDEKTTAPLLPADPEKEEVNEEDEVGSKANEEMEPEDKVKPDSTDEKGADIGKEAQPVEQAAEAAEEQPKEAPPTEESAKTEGQDNVKADA